MNGLLGLTNAVLSVLPAQAMPTSSLAASGSMYALALLGLSRIERQRFATEPQV